MSEARGDRRVTLEGCRDPGFTPGAADVAALLELWEHTRRTGDGDLPPRDCAKLVVKALSRGDRGVARALLHRWTDAGATERALRLRAVTRIGQRLELPELTTQLDAALRDPEPRVIREAVRAIGKLGGLEPSTYEGALLTIARSAGLPERRAAVEALGRIGGPAALEGLQALGGDDEQLTRRTAEAITLITRRGERAHRGRVRLDRPLPQPCTVRLRGRGGTAATMREQAEARLPKARPRRLDEATVELRWSGSLGQLFRVRTAAEVALCFPLPAGADPTDRIVTGLGRPALVRALQAWTEGRPRFRLAFTSGGRRRADVWTIARALRERESVLVNDSREVHWTIEVDEANGRLLCLPRGADARFAYRHADVPAATHPTFAALLAWAGRPTPGEVVWDPFCGSGTELVECATLADGLHLWGTDIDPRAIAAARQNLAAASIHPASVALQQASALTVSPCHDAAPVSLILSNPPMGRRVMVEGRGMRRLLDDFIAHAARVLAPGGRVVWLSPAPRATARTAHQRGLTVDELDAIDMGGFTSTPQVLRKPG